MAMVFGFEMAEAAKPKSPREATTRKPAPKVSKAAEQKALRLEHARELLGRHYKKSAVKSGEKISNINSDVYKLVEERLPKRHRKESKRIAKAIIEEAQKHEFDPVFLMSVIQGESSFNPDMVGGVGELGLMQIRPSTAKWIAPKFGMKFKQDKTLLDPVTNIQIGAAYLSWLRERFDSHARLYLAAYNMGQRNVDRALDKNIWPKDYPVHVMSRYVEFYSYIRDNKRGKNDGKTNKT